MNVNDTRITRRFDALKAEGRSGLVVFVTSGDPDYDTSVEILNGLADAGADLIELGMPFSDPMADGPAIQVSSQRALKNGQTLTKTIQSVRDYRTRDNDTPIILMGYYNPIYAYGVDAFLGDATEAGIDGLIIVDLPPEEERELCLPAIEAGVNFIYLTAPTTNEERLPRVLAHASGFIYYVSITGITGAGSATSADIAAQLDRIRAQSDLPIAVGFGITTPEKAADIASVADAAVVGSAVVKIIADNLDDDGKAKPGLADKVLGFVGELAAGVRGAAK
ncbi:MAG: tryptophan synthase subunit alpha [Rhodospirillales bacterium]|jgi:tryptophan synthase alpha chain|nr:tryptophan synthase subunit alpha [Rhodospirillales bacterium]MBT4040253.1 tryptophan synthase subunit alpha [Rhodospirillales bacterium]MBT4626542.1 tryptophan synthase subunit alpha [Rhodospirillales bacterium]MBT5352833.1 tryptophan synthase subunit alpha [Rhodospirillales bacterium]MBT5522336.1 tryptophan synthase subunit alpha [Rhodospirillales bacterium]